jgi:hypothetical protein
VHRGSEVFDPIVEDDVPDVDRADETIRLMTLYGLLAAAADAAAAAAITSPKEQSPSREELSGLLHQRLMAARDEHGLLPPSFDVHAHAALTLTRVLAPPASSAAPRDGADGAEHDEVPSSWYVHVVSARLDGVPSLRWKPDVEGSLLFEQSYASDGASGVTALTERVPLLACWPAEGAEETEARQVRGAVCANSVCTQLHAMVERLRAGEHHVLQARPPRPPPR